MQLARVLSLLIKTYS